MALKISWIDVIIFLVMVYFSIRGYKRGLAGEILSIVTLFLSFLLAYHYFGVVATYLENSIGLVSVIANIFGYVFVFVGVFIACTIIGIIFKRIVQWSFISGLDKVGGILFGLVRGTCIISIILVLLGMLRMPALTSRIAEKSFLARYVLFVSPYIYESTFVFWKDRRNFDADKYMNFISEDVQRYEYSVQKKTE